MYIPLCITRPRRGEIFFEAICPHILLFCEGGEIMFITGLYLYTLVSPTGNYISIQSIDGVFDVLRENEGCQFISKTLIGYQNCAIAD